ncbi:zinc finger BED domain-containing protein 1-like [Ctenocephalides felis]|uniref:zinc finger BED domain-containing protein 1-like n=1 Tax=Ctenocephalides felis TaxID=7515 RepID=UPI000E6E22D4|nr:zinc finger BED domain-containing protein 1-like [Ctenocephalides felis]
MVKNLNDAMRKRFYDKCNVESNKLYAEATILDPRFKKNGFSDITKYEKSVANLKKKFEENCLDLQVKNMTKQTEHSLSESVWQYYNSGNSVSEYRSHVAAGVIELNRYINEPIVSPNKDPLKWWYSNKLIYPNLYQLVLKRLNIIATSVPCERIFSKAGLTLTERRTRLNPKHLAELLFIGSNTESSVINFP